MNRPLSALVAAAAGVLAAAALLAAPARAASLTQVSSFGSNPGSLAMYSYQPDNLASGAALVVLLHGCTQDATGYFTNSGWRKYADQAGFALVLPQQSSSNNSSKCFNWFQSGDITRGSGEAASIRSMIAYAVSNYGVSASRVYVTGLSAGGAMSAVMLAAYPDVFAAGSIVAGLPYGCATSLTEATTCQYSPPTKTAQQWGDLARAGYSGYSGPYPRVAIWHGTSDTTVQPKNATNSRDQWTNVRGVSQTATSTSTLTGGTTLSVYGSDDVRLYQISGMAHGLPVDPGSGSDQCGSTAAYFLDYICSAYYDAVFFGLLSGSSPSPTATPTATASASPSPSASVSPTPSASSGPCYTASNYAHTVAGRAHQTLGYAYANGSNDYLGLWNTYATTSLRQTGTNYYVLVSAC
ncbi:poly(hydroxyalkanoate) depolymerase family esterase [Hamadaea flava]|uniref:PHB depolymerase family esterase n=1 Tax=Hamadaea flava TaxID=1742688 RepID=A0ABV8LVA8_9ACTN|nr:PHB depolymerase family esterase [Hamadaea flava]MCP2327806.1 poly(hydroxyalkanoate) depolymerase family esterase [Hamadaea flava]